MRTYQICQFTLVSVLTLSSFFISSKSQAQDFARNSIFLELGGNGALYSLNYDHKFFDHASARVGGMYLPLSAEDSDDRVNVALFPIMINYLVGSGSSRLEVGIGTLAGYVSGNADNENFSEGAVGGLTGTLGYRLQPVDGGFLFRIGVTPFTTGAGIQLWGGLSLGATF